MNKNWVFVFAAGLVEVLWVMGLKHSYNAITWIGTLIAIYISFDLMIRSSKALPVGTVYAVFTGIGAAGTVILDMVLFGDPFRWSKVVLIACLLVGIIGLKLVSGAKTKERA